MGRRDRDRRGQEKRETDRQTNRQRGKGKREADEGEMG